jgi:DNA mismatch endonuclease (patch repair protein)
MPDVMSKDQRSRLMAAVRGRNTRFELNIMRALSAELYPLGYRYRKHYRRLRGTPDIVFVGYRIAVFIDSDFWHGRNYHRLKSRMNGFWRAKIERNMERDRQVDRALRHEGWAVLRFGEAQIKTRPQSVVRKVRSKLEARKPHRTR